MAIKPGLPSAAPSDTPIIVISAPPIVRILLTADITNPPSHFVSADDDADDDIHVSSSSS